VPRAKDKLGAGGGFPLQRGEKEKGQKKRPDWLLEGVSYLGKTDTIFRRGRGEEGAAIFQEKQVVRYENLKQMRLRGPLKRQKEIKTPLSSGVAS